MSPKGLAVVGGSAIATAVIIGGVTYGASSNAPRDGDASRSASSRSASSADRASALAAASADGSLAAAVNDEACSKTAVPAFADSADARIGAELKSNPASQADPDHSPMSRDEALAAARNLSAVATGADGSASKVDLSSLPSSVVQMPFDSANKWISGSVSENSLVAANRCVWIVTVNAPFQPRSAPDPSVRITFDSFTAMFDTLSGEYLGLSAGTDAGSLITGDELSK